MIKQCLSHSADISPEATLEFIAWSDLNLMGMQKSQRSRGISWKQLDIREGHLYFQPAGRSVMCSVFIGPINIQLHNIQETFINFIAYATERLEREKVK